MGLCQSSSLHEQQVKKLLPGDCVLVFSKQTDSDVGKLSGGDSVSRQSQGD